MNISRIGCVAVLVVAALAGQAGASLIGLGQQPPDITVSAATISYNAGTGLLTIVGTPTVIDYDGAAPPDYGIINGGVGLIRSFQVSITLDSSGTLIGGVAGNDLAVVGLVDTDNSHTPSGGEQFTTLLTGEVTRFGYSETAPYRLFDLLFSVTGGSLQSDFGSQVGLIFDAVSYQAGKAFTGSFATDFAGAGFGNGDLFLTPEPASLALLLAGGLGGLAIRRRRV